MAYSHHAPVLHLCEDTWDTKDVEQLCSFGTLIAEERPENRRKRTAGKVLDESINEVDHETDINTAERTTGPDGNWYYRLSRKLFDNYLVTNCEDCRDGCEVRTTAVRTPLTTMLHLLVSLIGSHVDNFATGSLQLQGWGVQWWVLAAVERLAALFNELDFQFGEAADDVRNDLSQIVEDFKEDKEPGFDIPTSILFMRIAMGGMYSSLVLLEVSSSALASALERMGI